MAVTEVDEPLVAAFFVVEGGRLNPRAFKRRGFSERYDVERTLSSFAMVRGEEIVWRFALEMRSGSLWEVAFEARRSRVVLLRVDVGS